MAYMEKQNILGLANLICAKDLESMDLAMSILENTVLKYGERQNLRVLLDALLNKAMPFYKSIKLNVVLENFHIRQDAIRNLLTITRVANKIFNKCQLKLTDVFNVESSTTYSRLGLNYAMKLNQATYGNNPF